jgi:hypothetical protein
MSWFYSLIMLVLFVGMVGVIVSLPTVYQNPLFYILPAILFIAFLVTLKVG